MSVKQHRDNTIIPYIIEVMCLRLKEHEALTYLEERGFTISHDTYFRMRREVKESANTRLNLIAAEEFSAQHIQRIDTLKTIENELWSCYHSEQNPSKKANILIQISELQELLAAFYDSSRWVLEQAAKSKGRNYSKVSQEKN
jgi:hypothetical protein